MSFNHAAAPNLSDELDTLWRLFLNSSTMKEGMHMPRPMVVYFPWWWCWMRSPVMFCLFSVKSVCLRMPSSSAPPT